MRVRIIAGVLAAAVLAVLAFALLSPKEYNGSASVYNRITIQLSDDTFYDVRVPAEAKLLQTDGATIYEFDLLTVGLQDLEPVNLCKIQVEGRWIYATSDKNWLRATATGFQEEMPYKGTYSTGNVKWVDKIPSVVTELDKELLEELREGKAVAFGGEDFIVSQVAYGTYEHAQERAFTKMHTLYRQGLRTGYDNGRKTWMESGPYTVAVSSINFNTCLVISAHGEMGRQYAAALMRDVS